MGKEGQTKNSSISMQSVNYLAKTPVIPNISI